MAVSFKDDKKVFNVYPCNSQLLVSIKMTRLHIIQSDLRILYEFLRYLGVDLARPTRKKSRCTAFFAVLAAAVIICSIFAILSEVLYCGVIKLVTFPVVCFNIFILLLTLALWGSVFHNRHRIARLSDKYFRRPCLSWGIQYLLVCYVCLLTLLATCSTFIAIHDDSLEFYLHCYLYGRDLRTIPVLCKETLLFVFLMAENILHFFVPNLLTALVVYLFKQFQQGIVDFLELWKSEFEASPSDVKNLLVAYDTLRRNFDTLHALVSFPVLAILAQKFLTLFFALTVMLTTDTNRMLAELVESAFFSVNAVVSMTLLIVAGSRIHEDHRKIGPLCIGEIAASVQKGNALSEGRKIEVLFALKTFVEKERMTITAAGMVPLTRSLFLQSGAALITYGVLIIQFGALNS